MSGTRAISTTSRRELSSRFFFFLQSKAPKEINAILTETLACVLPGRAKDLTASLYNKVIFMDYAARSKILRFSNWCIKVISPTCNITWIEAFQMKIKIANFYVQFVESLCPNSIETF